MQYLCDKSSHVSVLGNDDVLSVALYINGVRDKVTQVRKVEVRSCTIQIIA